MSDRFGFKRTIKLDFPTTTLDNLPIRDLVISIGKAMKEIEPEQIYLLNGSDVHTDHQVVFKAAYSCTKNFRYPFIKKLLIYECLSETEFAPALAKNQFIPNVFIDISDYFDSKTDILKIYESEVMEDNLPRSLSAVKALAQYRGSRIGKKYAEAFMLLFEIN